MPAQRRLATREGGHQRGDVITEAYTGIKRELYREFLIDKVLPAIKDKMPGSLTRELIIQQDNSPVHVPPNDPAFLLTVQDLKLNVKIQNQPPQSPDLNVLDLGFFNSIQSIKDEIAVTSVGSLIRQSSMPSIQ